MCMYCVVSQYRSVNYKVITVRIPTMKVITITVQTIEIITLVRTQTMHASRQYLQRFFYCNIGSLDPIPDFYFIFPRLAGE